MSRLSLARYLAEPGAIIRATGGLGLLEMELGNYSLAETFLEEALSLARQHQDKKIIGDILHAQSELARLRNDEWTAISFLEEAVSLLRQANDPWNLALALSDMALVQIRLGKQVQAKENLLESLSLYRNHGAQSHQLSFLLGMAGLALQARGDKSGSIRAGKLLGAVDALQTKLYGDSSFNPSDLEDIAIYIAQAQAHLSEQEWESSYHQGQSMTIEQAIDYALEDTVDIPIEL